MHIHTYIHNCLNLWNYGSRHSDGVRSKLPSSCLVNFAKDQVPLSNYRHFFGNSNGNEILEGLCFGSMKPFDNKICEGVSGSDVAFLWNWALLSCKWKDSIEVTIISNSGVSLTLMTINKNSHALPTIVYLGKRKVWVIWHGFVWEIIIIFTIRYVIQVQGVGMFGSHGWHGLL